MSTLLPYAIFALIVVFSSEIRHVLASLVMLCRSQGAQVIAEGIETQAELEAVIEAGVPLGQGYYLGRPSANGAIRWHPT